MLAVIALSLQACAGNVLRTPEHSRHAHNSNALWHIVHTQCVPKAQNGRPPAPCSRVWLNHGVQRGYALLKDLRGRSQYLLIPTRRITGIESAALLSPGTPNYFAAAWRARHYVGAALDRSMPRSDISLAINSKRGRTQSQLHIHIDCVRADVKRALAQIAPHLDGHWRRLDRTLAGHRYRALRVVGRRLEVNPFHRLAAALPPGAHMGDDTLVVVGHTFAHDRPGFILLAGTASAHDPASGEVLQDHACKLAASVPVMVKH